MNKSLAIKIAIFCASFAFLVAFKLAGVFGFERVGSLTGFAIFFAYICPLLIGFVTLEHYASSRSAQNSKKFQYLNFIVIFLYLTYAAAKWLDLGMQKWVADILPDISSNLYLIWFLLPTVLIIQAFFLRSKAETATK